MLETFDTQMLDYQNDLDFSMHVSSTDSWLQEEAVMEDDDHSQLTVEVDMEPYDDSEDHNEYEMEDGSEPNELDASPLDVELANTPLSVVQKTDTSTSNNSPDSIHTALDLTNSFVTDSDPHFLHAEPSNSPHSSDTALVSDNVASSNILLSLSKEEALPSTPSFQHVDVAADGGHLTSTALVYSDHVGVAPEPDSVSAAQRHLDHHTADEDQHVSVSDNGEIISAAGEIEVSCSDGSTVSSEYVPHILQPVVDREDPVDRDGSAGDPHEISEGVYIDPPPAVLLTFPSANHPEISLFNTPPAVQLADNLRSGFVVLLAHLPTLYYEPISTVFEALRQEEHIVAILELLDGELVFDAYDLQLTIHEDGIYAREISLHDLNVLHDGLNISGSLRLRIHAFSPRFIVQYHLLQEQVARLTAADFGEVVATPLAADHEDPLYESQAQLGNKASMAGERTGHSQDESCANTADEPATHEPEEQRIYGKNKHAPEEEEGKADLITQFTDSADPIPLENSALSRLEAHVAESKGNEDRQDAIGEEYEDHEEQDDNKEQGDGAAQDNGAEQEDGAERENGAEQEDATHALEYTDKLPSTLEVGESTETDASVPVDDEYTEYDQYTEHGELGDGEYGEVPLNEENLQREAPIVLHKQSEASSAVTTSNVVSVLEDLIGAESHHQEFRTSSELQDEVSDKQGPSKLEPFFDSKPNMKPAHQNDDRATFSQYDEIQVFYRTDTNEEVELWDDDSDGGDGDPNTTWEAEHETESNQSSVTLSSKLSSKRSISEAELEQDYDNTPSPGSKRLRVE